MAINRKQIYNHKGKLIISGNRGNWKVCTFTSIAALGRFATLAEARKFADNLIKKANEI